VDNKNVGLDSRLLSILVCPHDKGLLHYFADEDILYNPRMRLSYRVEDGIPVMLADEAVTVDEDEHQRLMSEAEAQAGSS